MDGPGEMAGMMDRVLAGAFRRSRGNSNRQRLERSMKGFVDDIEKLTEENEDFRRVLYTGHHLQLVLMSLRPGEEIGEEVHEDRDQFFRIEEGEGEVVIDGARHRVEDDDAIIVPAGARHNVICVGDSPLRLYTLYGPPEHRDGVAHRTKADVREEHFDGRTTE
jgi:mannose-6-phosphate isomerase-like protein (cupin superfamily)